MKFESGIAQKPDKIPATVAPAFVISIGVEGDSKIGNAA